MPRALKLPFASAVGIVWTVLAAAAPAQEAERRSERSEGANEELPCVEAPAEGTAVKVVDAATGKPVGGALVTWFEERSDGRDCLAPEPELRELRRQFGTTVRTAVDGTTRVGRFFRIMASDGDHYAGAWRAPRGGPLVLALRPSRSIVVTTLDRERRPVANVRIEVRTREEDGRGEWTSTTGPDGRVAFGPLDLFAAFESEALRELWVAVDAPLGAPIRQRFTLAEMPEEPVSFTMPPTGRLVIDVVDADGKPLDVLGFTTVRERWEQSEDEAGDASGARWPRVSWHDYDRRSHYELPHVEIGLRFVVDSSKDDHEDAKQVVDGPSKPGETVIVRLVAPTPSPSEKVSARILDEKGEPLAGREVRLLWNDDSTRVTRRELARGTTDASGRIDAKLDDWERRSFGNEIDLWIEAVVARPDGNGIEASGMISLPKTMHVGGLDFGEIRVHPGPVFVSGTVVDDAGSPIAGAEIRVTVVPAGPAFLSGDFTDRSLTATTDAEGRFTIWGDAPVGQISICAEPGDVERKVPLENSSDCIDLKPGATDLRFVLWRCGTIVARVLGDPAEIDDLSFSTSSKRPDGEVVGGWSGGFDAEGIVETEVVIGSATLTISRGGTVVATRENIEVKPGAVVELPPIELGAAPHQVELTIVDELGKPVPAGWIVMPDPEDDARAAEMKKMFAHLGADHPLLHSFPRRPHVSVFEEGKFTLRSDRPLPSFAVGAAGRTAVVVRHPATAERVVLEPAPYVALVLEYDGDAVPEPLKFMVNVGPTSDDEEWFRFGPQHAMGFEIESLQLAKTEGIVLERGHPVELPVRCLGATQLDLVLGEKRPGGFGGTTIACDPARIEVERSRDDQLFHVKVERAAIDPILQQRKEQDARPSRR